MYKLVIANILHRPVRSLISVRAFALEVIMILSIVGIFMGILNDTKERTNGIGADLMMRPSHASIMTGISGAPMPIRDAEAVRKLAHVTVVAPVSTKLNTEGKIEVINGIDFNTFNALKPFHFLAGGPFTGPHDVIIDDVFAGTQHHVGDTIKVLDTPFHISGIVESGRGARKLLPIDAMNPITGDYGTCSSFYIKSDDPSHDEAIIQEIHATKGLEDFPVQTVQDWMSQMTPDRLPGFNLALDVVTVIAVIVGFLVIFQSMYTAVLERTREIGILKSMGASKAAIVSVVLRETGVVAIAGVILGIAGTYGVQLLMRHVLPTTHFQITADWLGKGALIAFCGALCGALYPAWLAARKDPIDALAYE